MSLTMLSCFKNCFDGLGFTAPTVPRREFNPIVLDTSHMEYCMIVALCPGQEVVIIKNGLRVLGSGGALCSAPLVQSKSYFEVKLQQSGVWGVGLATRTAGLDNAPGGHDTESWVLCSDGSLRHGGATLDRVTNAAVEGDIVGVAFDHIELNFFVNGKAMERPMTGIRGTVYPALFVGDGAILDIILDKFHNRLPNGFERIMLEQSLL